MPYINLGGVEKVHFIGIGGIGVSAIARMMLLSGKKVTGSDVRPSEITEELRKLGAVFFDGHCAENVPPDADLVIYTIAVTSDNPEFIEAKRRGIKMMSYPESLGLISKDKYTIAVSGTHGKTTTTAMIGKVLTDAGLAPTIIVGSLIKDAVGNRTNFIVGEGKYLVVEACEYRRSFLNINPTIAVITNIDNDHLDYYKNLADIAKAFGEFAAKVPKSGYVVTNVRDKNTKLAIKNPLARVVDYGEFREKNIKLKVPGAHNKENAAAVLAVAHILGIEKKKAVKFLEEFTGTWRRFEYKGKTKNGVLVYDDYAHHPTEIRATLAGARELYPKRRITVVFQPHLYSRTKLLLNEFARAFKDAAQVILLPIYAAREKDPGDINSEMLVARILKNGGKAVFAASFESAAKTADASLRRGDLFITMGAGEAFKSGDWLLSVPLAGS